MFKYLFFSFYFLLFTFSKVKMSTKINESNFICNVCNKSYKTKQNYDKHIKSIHTVKIEKEEEENKINQLLNRVNELEEKYNQIITLFISSNPTSYLGTVYRLSNLK